jgi:predicted lipoprotein with Yx(FWY)xxD motif
MTRLWAAGIVPAALALVAAGCGGGNSATSSSSYAGAKSPSTTNARAAAIGTRKVGLGTVLVDSSGRTLYLFEKDKGATSNCAGACTAAWPPVTTSGNPVAQQGVDAAKLGTTKRSDGNLEVTYGGHPLYLYAGDTRPGDTGGQGLDDFGAEWYALGSNGSKIDED